MGLKNIITDLGKLDSDIELEFKNIYCPLYILSVLIHRASIAGEAVSSKLRSWDLQGFPSTPLQSDVCSCIASFWGHRCGQVIQSVLKAIGHTHTINVGGPFEPKCLQLAEKILHVTNQDSVTVVSSKQYEYLKKNALLAPVSGSRVGSFYIFGKYKGIIDDVICRPRETVVFSPAAFDFKWGSPLHPVELISGPTVETITSRVQWHVRPSGYEWIGPQSNFVTNVDLENVQNWQPLGNELPGVVILKP